MDKVVKNIKKLGLILAMSGTGILKSYLIFLLDHKGEIGHLWSF